MFSDNISNLFRIIADFCGYFDKIESFNQQKNKALDAGGNKLGGILKTKAHSNYQHSYSYHL